jgi:uncharacterized lipoprotein
MKYLYLVVLGLLLVFILSACQSFKAEGETQQVYPAPAEALPASAETYPAPAQAYPQPQIYDPYPDSETSTLEAVEIEWGQAEKIIMNGAVSQVTQTHDGKVILRLKDGSVFTAEQPQLDEVLRVIEKCGDLCKDIKIATE